MPNFYIVAISEVGMSKKTIIWRNIRMQNYYDHTDLERVPELARLAPKASSSFFKFELDVYHQETQVPAMTKELIAVAVAHIVGCPYCIDVHVQKYFDLGGTKEEIMEAVFVAASTRAGAVLSHATQALKSFESKAKVKDRLESNNEAVPKCFC